MRSREHASWGLVVLFIFEGFTRGPAKEGEVTHTVPSSQPTYGKLRHGFVCERVPHVTLKSIANNTEIDVIWEKWQQILEPIRKHINAALGKDWQEWDIPTHFANEDLEKVGDVVETVGFLRESPPPGGRPASRDRRD